MAFLKRMVFLLALITLTFQAAAQIEEDRLKANMLLYIAEMVEWPDSLNTTEHFTIHLYDASVVFKNELYAISRSKRIRSKVIDISEGVPDLENNQPNILFIGKGRNAEVEQLHIDFAHLPILFVTNEFPDKWYVMINFQKEKVGDIIKFEVNPLNMLFTGMDYDEELLAYGKSTFSIKETFRIGYSRTKRIYQQIDSLERVNLNIKALNSTLREEITHYRDEIKTYENDILEKNKRLSLLNDSLATQIYVLGIHSNLLVKQQSQLVAQQTKLDSSNLQYAALLDQTKTLTSNIALSQALLNNLDNEIALKEDLINQQNTELGEKESLIQAQSTSLILLSALGIAIIFVSILLYRANRSKENFNLALIKANDDLGAANEELNTTNELLAEQKIELETALMQLNKTQGLLIQSEKLASLGVFTSGIAHELNNPINYISAGSQALFDSLDTINAIALKANPEIAPEIEIQRTLRESIEMGVNKTTTIISSLRNYAFTDSESMVTYDLSICLKDALTLLNNTYKDHIEIQNTLPDKLFVSCLPGKINQVFVNIINNAVQAMIESNPNQKGVLTISYKKIKHGKAYQITFEDNGPGISEQNLSKLFDPFFTTKEVGKGTGLGLYIVHGIIKKHNGTISYKSDLGKGTKAIITLPINQD